MTQRLPPDIDRMLWEIAESQDSNAYDDFEARFPQLVGELGKRIQLVRELRDARSSGSHRAVPHFDRRVPTRLGPQPKAILAMAFATLACLAIGAYVVTGRLANSAHVIPPIPVPLGPPSSGFIENPLSNPPRTESTGGQEIPKTPDYTSKLSPPTEVAPYLKPQNVRIDRAKLQIAILAVATNGKLEVEFAPNMPNPDIRMDYRNMSAVDILKDLGPRFGFTAFREGGNKILIVPQVDPKLALLPPAGGSGSATNLEPDASTDDGASNKPKPRAGNVSGPS
jgi:hypothetical protein